MHKFKNLAGQRFGRLAVTADFERRGYDTYWLCLCDCGKTTKVRVGHLCAGKIQSCGCLANEMIGNRARRHGMHRSPEWRSWMKMRGRCKDPNNNEFHRYGGSCVTICGAWDNFAQFYADMGSKPTPKHSIDRIDPDGNYEPKNCRWADAITQANNHRNSKKITFSGLTMTPAQWERHLNLPRQIVNSRMRSGWIVEKTLTAPVRRWASV